MTYQNPLIEKPARGLPREIGIVGAGTIGPDIGYYLKSAIPGLKLVLVDIDEKALEKATARIAAYAEKGVKKRKLTPDQAKAVTQNLEATTDYGALANCDWVIEAATEELDLKRRIFRDIEKVVRKETLITSNTSSIPAARLFCELAAPERTTVTHFFAPAFRNPAVEVIDWEKGAKENVEYLRWLFAATGKVPFVTSDDICFMLDRIFDNWCNDAAYLLDQATASEIDSVSHRYVHAGPFFVLNLANGNPIIVKTNKLQMEEGKCYEPASIFPSVASWNTVLPGKGIDVPEETANAVNRRLLGILFSQSFDIVDRKIGTPEDLNLGCLLALGFKKGPLDLMAEVGEERTHEIITTFQEDRPGMPGPKQPIAAYQDFRRHILVDEKDSVCILTLRRPQAMNALDDTVTDEILAAIKEREQDPAVTGFVITGYGDKAFCAGADIGRFPEVLGKKEEAARYARDCSRLLRHLDAMEKPVVAALNGFALGGGFELALRTHAIVATKAAWMQLPEITLGIVPGIGGMVVPYRRWPKGAPIFNEMIQTGRKLKAKEALELGLIEGLADGSHELIALAVARVRELAGRVPRIPEEVVELAPVGEAAEGKFPLSRKVQAIARKAIEEAARAKSLDAALEIGYQAFGESACTAGAKEGVTAFIERRKPDFKTTG